MWGAPMRGKTARYAVPRGVTTLTLKAQAVLVEGNIQQLREELFLTKYWTQRIVDFLWKFSKRQLPKLNQVHQLFYNQLRQQGFRAHQAKQIYKYALAVVKATKQNRGSKPTLKKLTARLDKYDAQVDTENWTVVLKLRNRVFKLKLKHRLSYLKKFTNRKWYEIIVSIDRLGRIWIAIPFRWEYSPYEPNGCISLDLNVKKLVSYNGRKIRRYNTRFKDAYSKKVHAERLQKKYPKRWRYNSRILNRIRSLHRKGRNIITDWSRKFAKQFVLKAKKQKKAIVLEDLTGLWSNRSKQGGTLADRLSRFTYRKLQQAIITKAIEYSVPILLVDPRNTSKTCPKCGIEMQKVMPRLLRCPKCGLILDRDSIGAMNIWKKGGCGGALGLPRMPPL